ncbi:NADH dehydrogenase [ubiquinone] 1 subunit C1, mitochondrial [Hemibagrus wyckioides]|nr:NADH dehydrogenase [ubiquinone] 1 subunit C1, mitochondrial [Hemibagrus wyckioides]
MAFQGRLIEHRFNRAARPLVSVKMPLGRLLLRTSTLNKIVSRNAFTASKPDPSKPNLLRVGLAFGTTALLWTMLFKRHWSDVQEYKASNGLE